MKANKLNKKLHKYLSIPFGLIISVLCLTGALLVFQQETLMLLNPKHYKLNKLEVEGKTPIPFPELIPLVNGQLEENTVSTVTVYKDPQRTYQMGLKEGFRKSVFVNPYTGEIRGEYAVRDSSFFQIMRMHRWLMDSSMTWGKYTVGWATVFFIVILITGWYYIRKKTKSSFKVHFTKGSKRLIFDLHNSLGNYAALVLIICSLTGLMWSFESYRNTVFYIFGDRPKPEQKEARNTRGGGKEKKTEPETIYYTAWLEALEAVKLQQDTYDYWRVSNGTINAHPDNTYRTRVQDEFKFDLQTGNISKYTAFADKDVRSKVWAWAYSLHVGDYWGIWSKIFTFVFCLVGASLPFTGYYTWYKKWKKKKENKLKKIKRERVSII